MEQKANGVCRFCLKSFAGAAISRHLLACNRKKEQDQQSAVTKKAPYPIYYLKISSSPEYWLHIEMKAAARLNQLDDFLRRIWLECCGHLSAFTIKGIEHQDTSKGWDSIWGEKPESMNARLIDLLAVGDKFEYEYDFGSTTYLVGKVVAARQGVLDAEVRILARNNPLIFKCADCGQKASDFCTDCEAFLCEQCLSDHECGEDMALPVVNSPRMGICGYCDDYNYDDFVLPAEE